jgi:hypothetical protein
MASVAVKMMMRYQDSVVLTYLAIRLRSEYIFMLAERSRSLFRELLSVLRGRKISPTFKSAAKIGTVMVI